MCSNVGSFKIGLFKITQCFFLNNPEMSSPINLFNIKINKFQQLHDNDLSRKINKNSDFQKLSTVQNCTQNCNHILLCSKLFNRPYVFPLTSIVSKSCNIECCVNNMFQINQNIIVSQGSELILSMCRRTAISDQHPLIQV